MKLNKKISIALPVFLLLFLTLALFSCSGNDTEGGVTYDGNIAIGCDESATEVVLREGTVGISSNAFAGCKDLKKITIPASVSSIQPGAFTGCDALFEGQGEIKYADNWVIYADKDVENIIIKENAVGIAYDAFSSCKNVKTLVIPSSVKYIGKNILYGADQITDITLPFIGSNIATNKYLGYLFGAISSGYNPDYVPKSLKTVTLTAENVVEKECFANCTNIAEIKLSDSVTAIGERAFSGCTALTKINMPENVASIGAYAFAECHSLLELTLPENIKALPMFAIKGCISLTEITIPKSVTEIGACALANCANLETVNLPAELGKIGQQAFDGCNKLRYIEIPSGEIGKGAFNECASLETVVIGANVTKMLDNAFFSCISLTEMTFEAGCNLVSIGEEVFCYCPFTELILPDKLTEIGANAFYNCNGLTTLTIPDSVTKIGANAFFNCINLVETKNNVDYVDGWIVGALSSVTYVIIDEDVRGVVSSVFASCTHLSAVYITNTENGTTPVIDQVGSLNSYFESATRYCYSESPTENKTGWHYVDGIPTVW